MPSVPCKVRANVRPSTRPSGEGMAHRSVREIAEDPWGDTRGSFPGREGGWDDFDFVQWVRGMFVPDDWLDYYRYLYGDRRDLPSTPIPVGIPEILPIPEIPGDELSDLLIGESPGIPPPIPDPVISVMPGEDAVVPDPNYPGLWCVGPICALSEAGVNILLAEQGRTNIEGPAPIGGDDMAHGDFWEDLGDVFIDWINPVTQPEWTLPFQPDTGPMTPGPAPGPGPGPAAAAACGPGGSPVWKKVCGQYKWVYPKRRRRRQLLTESDYNALLRIENLKVNKNMSVAIAKALTR